MNNVQKKILLIEDDISIVRMYSIKLQRDGFLVTPARSAEEALKVLKNEIFDIILLDIMLPDKSGLEILKEIKAMPKVKEIPVIMLTVLPEVIALKKAISLGASSYLIKSETTPESLSKYIQLELFKNNGRK